MCVSPNICILSYTCTYSSFSFYTYTSNVETKEGAKVGITIGTKVGRRVSNSEHLCEICKNKRGNRRILEQLCELSGNKHGNRRIKGT